MPRRTGHNRDLRHNRLFRERRNAGARERPQRERRPSHSRRDGDGRSEIDAACDHVIGTVEAYSNVAVHPQITGQLTSVDFKEGGDVTKGEIIFTLDFRPLESALEQAQANLARDMAQAANARSSSARYQDLQSRGIATKEQADQSRTRPTRSTRPSRPIARRSTTPKSIAIRDHHGADYGPHRGVDGERATLCAPTMRRRSSSSTRSRHLRLVWNPRGPASGSEALSGAGLGRRRGGSAWRDDELKRTDHLYRQRRRCDNRANQIKASFPTKTVSSGRGSSSTSR